MRFGGSQVIFIRQSVDTNWSSVKPIVAEPVASTLIADLRLSVVERWSGDRPFRQTNGGAI